jgi:hypothetical protein
LTRKCFESILLWFLNCSRPGVSNAILFTIPSEIKKINIYPCEMHMLRDWRNNIS